jgi:hypothetical protein
MGGQATLRGGVGVPKSPGLGRLSRDASRFHGLVEMVAPDAPFLADLVGLKLAPKDPVTDRPFLHLQACSNLLDLEVLRILGCVIGHSRRFAVFPRLHEYGCMDRCMGVGDCDFGRNERARTINSQAPTLPDGRRVR